MVVALAGYGAGGSRSRVEGFWGERFARVAGFDVSVLDVIEGLGGGGGA